MAQWESARLEAEARLVRESKLRSTAAAAAAAATSPSSASLNPHPGSSSSSAAVKPAQSLPCLDVLKAWQGVWSKSSKGSVIAGIIPPTSQDLDSPTSTLSFSSDNTLPIFPAPTFAFSASAHASIAAADNNKDSSSSNPTTMRTSMIEFINSSSSMCKEEEAEEMKGYAKHDKSRMESSMFPVHDVVEFSAEGRWSPEVPSKTTGGPHFTDGFTDLLMENSDEEEEEENASDGSDNNNNLNNSNGSDEDEGKNYWNSILNLVNSSPSESPLF